MFQKQLTFILITLLASLCLANSVHADLNFQTDLTVGQRPPNTEYKRKVKQDGTYKISPISPSSISVGTGAYAYGFGWATAKIAGTVNGSKTSTTKSYKVGKWGSIVAFSPLRNNFTNERKWVSAYIRGPFSHAAKSTPYTWNADAEIKLQGYWFNDSKGWTPAPPNVKVSEGNTGQWTVTEVKVCTACGEEVSDFTQHQVTCPGCGTTYYTCTSQRVLAANSIAETDGWGRHWQGRCVDGFAKGCGALIWACNNGIHGSKRCASCNNWKRDCITHVCPNGGTARNNRGGAIGGGGGSDSYVACPAGSSCSRGGRVSAPSEHKRRSNSGCGHRFYECIDGEGPKHRLRTCSRCNTRYTQCGNWGPCRHNGRTYVYHN